MGRRFGGRACGAPSASAGVFKNTIAISHLSSKAQRLEVLQRYAILDTAPDASFDALTALAAFITDTPIALFSLVDSERQWFKSRVGIDATETPRDISLCRHVVTDGEPLIVPNATEDPRFADNPLVLGAPKLALLHRLSAGSRGRRRARYPLRRHRDARNRLLRLP